jgi:uncharacterized membrane protein
VRVGYGYGLIVAILLAIVLYLFGLINPEQTVSALLLFVGLWTMIFGGTAKGEKTYYVGWGAVIAVLSTFIIIPLAYTIALVLIVVIIFTIFTATRSKRTTETVAQQTDSRM